MVGSGVKAEGVKKFEEVEVVTEAPALLSITLCGSTVQGSTCIAIRAL